MDSQRPIQKLFKIINQQRYQKLLTSFKIESFVQFKHYFLLIQTSQQLTRIMSEEIGLVHGYWAIRGAGQVSRHLLAYCQAQWKDYRYFSPEEWFDQDIKQLGIPCPNLPYLIDGDFKLTQASAIQKYIIRKFNKLDLLGKNIKDTALMDMIIGVAAEVKNLVAPLIMDKNWELKVGQVGKKAEKRLKYIRDFYGQKEFVLGYLTLADFFLAEFSHYIEKILPQLFEKNPFLLRCRHAVESIPSIQKYYESEKAVKGPFMPPYAQIKF